MTKNIKKIALGLTGLTTVVVPVATAVSCDNNGGGSKSWEGKDDGKYTIMTAFSSTGQQHTALEYVIKLWNDSHKDKHIDIVDAEGGYSAIAPQLANEIEANDTTKIPNMILDYPDTIGTLAKYDAQLNLDDEAGTIRNLFDDSLVSINDQIGGVESGKLFAIPIAKSVDMASYNAPVLKVIIDLARKQGLFEDATKTPEIEKILAKAGTTDEAGVKAIWVQKATLPTFTTKFGDEILTDSSKMLDFITEAASMFDQTKNPTGAIFGIDSTTNFIYSSVFQKAGGDFAKFLFSKGTDGYIHYNWDDKNSDGYKIFAEVYGKLQKAIDAGAVYVNTGGAYSSSLETQHKIAFAYGSTAGYSHNYVKSTSGSTSKTTITAKDASGKDVNITSNTDAFDKTKATAEVVGEYSTYKNKIYLSTSQHTLPTTGKVYDIKLANATKDQEVQDFINNNPGALFVSGSNNINKVDKKVELGIVNGHEKYLTVAVSTTTPATTNASGNTSETLSDDKTLQQNELVIEKTPTKFDGGQAATLLQGPSLIAVHNSTEDAVVKEFAKWFMTEKINNDKYADKTPAEIFASKANYTLPTKDGLKEIKDPSSLYGGGKITAEALLEIADGKALAFDNPSDDTTGNFREVLQSTIAAQYTNHVNKKIALDADKIYEAVQHSIQK